MTAADLAAIRDRLRAFICNEILLAPSRPLGDDEPLLTSGLVDSLAMAQIGMFIEDEFGIYVPDPDLVIENLDTVSAIAAVIVRARDGRQPRR